MTTTTCSEGLRQFESTNGEILQHNAKHNTTLVPLRYKEDPSLGRWVMRQRLEYRKFQKCGEAKITAGRIRRLEAIGFEWDPQETKWNQM